MTGGNSTTKNNTRPRRTRRILIIVGVILIVLVIIYLGIGGFAISEIMKIGDHPQYEDTPGTFGLEYEDVRLKARGEEIETAAWYMPNETSDSAVIMVHGRNASKQNAVSGNFPKLGAALHNAGYAVLMIDSRGHGDSEGERFSFGIHERQDVKGAVDYLVAKGYQPGKIGVLALSLGGTGAIGATSEEPAIGALVVESTLAELDPLIEEQWENETTLPRFFLPGVYLMNRLLFGYDLSGIRPVEEVEQIAPRPIFVIHCTEDEVIPLWQAEELLEAAPQAESWIVNDCEHAEIYRDHPQEYEERLTTFLRKYLK